MSTNTPLHNVLEEHARDVHGIPTGDRLGQVHGRIRGVRRRRRAGVAAVAAAAIAVIGLVTLLPRHPEAAPTDRDLAGHTAPKAMDSLGFSYEFADASEGDGRVQMRLPESDRPRLVTWAGSDSQVELRSTADIDGDGSGPDRVTSTATDFSDFHYVRPGEPLNLTVQSEQGQVAVAVYDLERLPDRVFHDGVFFRKDAAGSKLIGASFGDPGETEITATFTMPEHGLQTSEICYGAPEGYSWAMKVVPGVTHSAPCGQSDLFDPAAGLSPVDGLPTDGLQPGDRVTARIWLTDGRDSLRGEQPVVEAPDVRLGLALYAAPAPAATVGGHEFATLIERDGHLYAYADSTSSTPGSADLSWTVEAGETPLLVMSFSSNGRAGILKRFADDRQIDVIARGPAPGGHTEIIGVIRNDSVVYRMTGRSVIAPRTVLGFATYERVD